MITAPAQCAVGINGHVSSFAAHASGSMPEFPVQNDAVPHACSQGQHAHRFDTKLFAQAELELCEHRSICVTLKNNGPLELFLHFRQQRETVPTREVWGMVEPSGWEFQWSR